MIGQFDFIFRDVFIVSLDVYVEVVKVSVRLLQELVHQPDSSRYFLGEIYLFLLFYLFALKTSVEPVMQVPFLTQFHQYNQILVAKCKVTIDIEKTWMSDTLEVIDVLNDFSVHAAQVDDSGEHDVAMSFALHNVCLADL